METKKLEWTENKYGGCTAYAMRNLLRFELDYTVAGGYKVCIDGVQRLVLKARFADIDSAKNAAQNFFDNLLLT